MKNCLLVYILIVILSSLVTHFLFYGYPNETVFDEVHFGKFISGYFTGEYFFDIHPPLGKLLISGIGYLAGFKPGFSFAEIGQKFPDNTYLWLRLLPTLAGVLLPLVIFFLVLRLGLSRLAAFTAAMLVVFENALLVQSRFILLDSFLLLFGFSALLMYFIYRDTSKTPIPLFYDRNMMGQADKNRQVCYLLLAGIFGALSMSVKWTGATFLAIIIVAEIIGYLIIPRSRNYKIHARLIFQGIVFLIIVPLLIYFSIFSVHLGLLTKSGPGDAFMTPAFQKTLAGNGYQNNPEIKPLSLFEKFKELNFEMYRANANLTAGHPYSSKWYAWPFMIRPIYYWNDNPQTVPAKESRIYFLGNPIIWWASTVAIIYSLFCLASDIIRRKPKNKTLAIVGGAYLLNFLPFMGISRAMFLYHYMIGLTFSIIALIYLVDGLGNKNKIFTALIAVCAAAFVFFVPLSYGLPLASPIYHLRVWLPSWQ